INDAKDIKAFVLADPDCAHWNNIDTTGMIELYNDITDWELGAFNNFGTKEHPDYGNLVYVNTGQLRGHRIFAVRLHNGDWKKIWFRVLDFYVYTIMVSDLDNSNEVTITLDKALYAGKSFVYYDLENMAVVDIEPA